MNLFDLYAKITLDDSDYKKKLGDASDETGAFAAKLKTGLTSAAKVGAAAVTVASGAVIALTKSAVDSYSEYEQLVGGVETLFGAGGKSIEEYAESVGKTVDEVKKTYNNLITAQEGVMEDAANAYKTAGMSANEYMETVTSFAAALTSSLGGDTMDAAAYANVAITDMADNANKMGSSMESIQNAYQGFAKQNYTMLDNLKLGFGGTAKEMYRLMETAASLDEDFANNAVFSLDEKGHLEAGYADIVQAIHIVQTEMGITGTTADEAATTIQGSVASMKAAWANLVTGIGDENADLDTLIGDLVTSAETAAGNVLPRITQILSGMGTAIEQLAPVLTTEVPAIITDVLPSIISGGATLLTGLATGLISALPGLLSAAPEIINSLMAALSSSGPQLLDAGKQLLSMVGNGIMSGIPALVSVAVELMSNFGNYLKGNVPTFLQSGLEMLVSFTGMLRENASILVDGALSLMRNFAHGIADGIPTIIETVPAIVSNIANVINDNAPKLLKAAADIVGTIANGMIDAIPTLIKNIPQILKAIWNVFTAFQWLDLGSKIIEGIGNGLKGAGGFVNDQAKAIGDDLIGYFKGLPAKFVEIGKNLIDGLINGLTSKFEKVASNITGIASKITGLFTSAWDVHSPSRVFMGIGEHLMDGLSIGLEDGLPGLMGSVDDVTSRVKNGLDFGVVNGGFASSAIGMSSAAMANSMGEIGQSGGNYTFNLVLPDGTPLASYLFSPLVDYAKANGTPILNPA